MLPGNDSLFFESPSLIVSYKGIRSVTIDSQIASQLVLVFQNSVCSWQMRMNYTHQSIFIPKGGSFPLYCYVAAESPLGDLHPLGVIVVERSSIYSSRLYKVRWMNSSHITEKVQVKLLICSTHSLSHLPLLSSLSPPKGGDMLLLNLLTHPSAAIPLAILDVANIQWADIIDTPLVSHLPVSTYLSLLSRSINNDIKAFSRLALSNEGFAENEVSYFLTNMSTKTSRVLCAMVRSHYNDYFSPYLESLRTSLLSPSFDTAFFELSLEVLRILSSFLRLLPSSLFSTLYNSLVCVSNDHPLRLVTSLFFIHCGLRPLQYFLSLSPVPLPKLCILCRCIILKLLEISSGDEEDTTPDIWLDVFNATLQHISSLLSTSIPSLPSLPPLPSLSSSPLLPLSSTSPGVTDFPPSLVDSEKGNLLSQVRAFCDMHLPRIFLSEIGRSAAGGAERYLRLFAKLVSAVWNNENRNQKAPPLPTEDPSMKWSFQDRGECYMGSYDRGQVKKRLEYLLDRSLRDMRWGGLKLASWAVGGTSHRRNYSASNVSHHHMPLLPDPSSWSYDVSSPQSVVGLSGFLLTTSPVVVGRGEEREEREERDEREDKTFSPDARESVGDNSVGGKNQNKEKEKEKERERERKNEKKFSQFRIAAYELQEKLAKRPSPQTLLARGIITDNYFQLLFPSLTDPLLLVSDLSAAFLSATRPAQTSVYFKSGSLCLLPSSPSVLGKGSSLHSNRNYFCDPQPIHNTRLNEETPWIQESSRLHENNNRALDQRIHEGPLSPTVMIDTGGLMHESSIHSQGLIHDTMLHVSPLLHDNPLLVSNTIMHDNPLHGNNSMMHENTLLHDTLLHENPLHVKTNLLHDNCMHVSPTLLHDNTLHVNSNLLHDNASLHMSPNLIHDNGMHVSPALLHDSGLHVNASLLHETGLQVNNSLLHDNALIMHENSTSPLLHSPIMLHENPLLLHENPIHSSPPIMHDGSLHVSSLIVHDGGALGVHEGDNPLLRHSPNSPMHNGTTLPTGQSSRTPMHLQGSGPINSSLAVPHGLTNGLGTPSNSMVGLPQTMATGMDVDDLRGGSGDTDALNMAQQHMSKQHSPEQHMTGQLLSQHLGGQPILSGGLGLLSTGVHSAPPNLSLMSSPSTLISSPHAMVHTPQTLIPTSHTHHASSAQLNILPAPPHISSSHLTSQLLPSHSASNAIHPPSGIHSAPGPLMNAPSPLLPSASSSHLISNNSSHFPVSAPYMPSTSPLLSTNSPHHISNNPLLSSPSPLAPSPSSHLPSPSPLLNVPSPLLPTPFIENLREEENANYWKWMVEKYSQALHQEQMDKAKWQDKFFELYQKQQTSLTHKTSPPPPPPPRPPCVSSFPVPHSGEPLNLDTSGTGSDINFLSVLPPKASPFLCILQDFIFGEKNVKKKEKPIKKKPPTIKTKKRTPT